MIEFKNLCQEKPYSMFKDKYFEALDAGQNNIEAISISSYNKHISEVDARYVNLKFIDKRNFIFFSNYESPKSLAFKSFNQISALIYWPSINTQIRMKAKIFRTSLNYNNEYFKKRSIEKNALAICSNQSQPISSYDEVIKKYNDVKKEKDLSHCPIYWGGFSFAPYYFEFWEGHESRINKRRVFNKIDSGWSEFNIQP